MIATLVTDRLSWWCGLNRAELHDAVIAHHHLWQTSTKTRKKFLDFVGAQLIRDAWEPKRDPRRELK